MPQSLTGVRIFFASPGGLGDERAAFRQVVERFNRDSANASDISFLPTGWEFTLAGFGRPQAMINEQVRESDYLIVMLWDQWGSNPGGESGYTSGTEEEFYVGLQCLADVEAAMRNIWVVFKAVDGRQLADPGKNLQKVLDFRSALEETKGALYSQFDTLDEFKDDLRANLHAWTRDWANGRTPPKADVDLSKFADAGGSKVLNAQATADEALAIGQLVVEAQAAAKRGRNTKAETLFARAIAGGYNREAYTQYVRFLRKRGRLAFAETFADRFMEEAQEAEDLEGEVEALANVALVNRQEGRHELCLSNLRRATEVVDELLATLGSDRSDDRARALSTKAFLLDNISITLGRMPGRQQDALEMLGKAREVQEQAGDLQGMAFTEKNIGTLMYRAGKLADAERQYRRALEMFRDVQYESGQSSTLGALAELYETQGEFELALERLEESTQVSTQRTPSRLAANHTVTVRVLIALGRVEDARAFADECARIGQEIGTPESIASSLLTAAHMSLATGDAVGAFAAASDALALYREVGNAIGIAAANIMLARSAGAGGTPEDPGRFLDAAEAALAETPPYAFQVQIDQVRAESPQSGPEPG
jgi:tetratricopeptide (TPR) repeat protein